MNNRIIHILVIILCCANISAQSIVFNETYDYGFSHYEGADYIAQNKNTNEYFMLSQHLNPFIIDSVTGISIFKIDEYGNVLNKNLVKFFDEACIGGGILLDKSSIYAVGVFRDVNENNNFDSYLIKYNENLDTIYTKVIDIGYNNNASIITKVDENRLRFISYYYPDSSISQNSQVVMVTIDTLGNILDQWEYGGPSYDFAYDYKPTDDGGYIIGGTTRDSLMDDADLFMLKIDSNGTEEWYHKYGTTNEETVRTWNYIETTADGGYLIAGEEDIPTPIGTPTEIKGFMIKTDGNGIELWKKK